MRAAVVSCMLVLASCTTVPKHPRPVYVYSSKVVCSPDQIDPVSLESVEWKAVVGQHASGGETASWLALTPEGYQTLVLNLTKILAQSEQMSAALTYYKECVATANEGRPHPSEEELEALKPDPDVRHWWRFWKPK